MVQFLAGIISLRRVRGPNPGRSHGSADTLPLRHSANIIISFAIYVFFSNNAMVRTNLMKDLSTEGRWHGRTGVYEISVASFDQDMQRFFLNILYRSQRNFARVTTVERASGVTFLIWFNFKVCDDITYPLPNLNSAIVVVWELISNFISHFTRHVVGLESFNVSKGEGHWWRHVA